MSEFTEVIHWQDEEGERWGVRIVAGNQSFNLSYNCDLQRDAEWYKAQLDRAIEFITRSAPYVVSESEPGPEG